MASTRAQQSRAPSIRDVARVAGVSHQTVSRVLNNSDAIRAETRDRVLAAMEQLQYRPNRAARALVTSRTHTIGVLTARRAHYGPAVALQAIEDAAVARGYNVTTSTLTETTDEAVRESIQRLLDLDVEGIVVIAPQQKVFDLIEELGIRTPYVTMRASVGEDPTALWVDQMEGARLATAHLLDLGHEYVRHIAGRRTGSRPMPGCRASSARCPTATCPSWRRSSGTGRPTSATTPGASSCGGGTARPCSARTTRWRSGSCTRLGPTAWTSPATCRWSATTTSRRRSTSGRRSPPSRSTSPSSAGAASTSCSPGRRAAAAHRHRPPARGARLHERAALALTRLAPRADAPLDDIAPRHEGRDVRAGARPGEHRRPRAGTGEHRRARHLLRPGARRDDRDQRPAWRRVTGRPAPPGRLGRTRRTCADIRNRTRKYPTPGGADRRVAPDGAGRYTNATIPN